MLTSPTKQKNLTTLEVQAQNIVNENDSESDHDVNDAQRYEELIESRKNRRAVSQLASQVLSDILNAGRMLVRLP